VVFYLADQKASQAKHFPVFLTILFSSHTPSLHLQLLLFTLTKQNSVLM